jgi:hypothetical protein
LLCTLCCTQARQEQQQLQAEVSKLHSASAATTEASLLLSPTGRQLDQTATSQLVWDTSQCVELFPLGQAQQAAAGAVDVTPGSAASTMAEPGFIWSRRTDLSYFSPLKSSKAVQQQASPNNSTPVPLQAAGYVDTNEDSPLSQQSLSMFSTSKADAASPASVNPRRLQLTTPISKLEQGHGAASGTTPLGSCSSSCTPVSSLSFTFADTAARQRDQQLGQAAAAVGSPQLVALMSPVFGIGPEQQQQGFWPSPALTDISMAALHGSRRPAASCNSYMLWLAADGAGAGASPAPARELALDFSPIVGRHANSSRPGAWFDGDGPCCFSFDPADDEDEEQQEQQQRRPSRRRWWLAVTLCTVVPLTLAAGDAAAWRFRKEEVQELAAALNLGAKVAAQQTRSAASAGWKQCQLGAAAVRAKAKSLVQRGSASADASNSSCEGRGVGVAS